MKTCKDRCGFAFGVDLPLVLTPGPSSGLCSCFLPVLPPPAWPSAPLVSLCPQASVAALCLLCRPRPGPHPWFSLHPQASVGALCLFRSAAPVLVPTLGFPFILRPLLVLSACFAALGLVLREPLMMLSIWLRPQVGARIDRG